MKNILVLCTGNSCRSIMAEALLNHLSAGRFKAFSAGSFPAGYVHPQSLATLKRHGIPAEGFSSKSWDVFTGTHIDIVVTVCDNAANEACPVFLGAPLKVHWGVPDPAHFKGSQAEIEAEFDRVFAMLEKRIMAFASLSFERMQQHELQQKLNDIGTL